jgi:hypothetical protein
MRDDYADRTPTTKRHDHAITDRRVDSVETLIIVEPLARGPWHINGDAQDRG